MEDWRVERDQALLVLTQKGKSPEERAEAAEVLVHLAAEGTDRSEELAFAIPQLLQDEQEHVRRSVVTLAAMVLPEGEVDSFLAARLGDPSEDVRIEACGQIADRGPRASRPALVTALQDSSFLVRFEAARGMAALHHSSGREVLCQALDDGTLRFRAISALAELGDPEAVPPLKKIFKKWLLPAFDKTQCAGALAALGDAEGVEYLLERVRTNKGALERPMAVELCGEVGVPNALERLTEVLKDRSDPARGAAARGLGHLGDVAAVPALCEVLQEAKLTEDLLLDVSEGLCALGTDDARAAVQGIVEKAPTEEARVELKALLEGRAA